MNEVQAAVGRVQLRRLDTFIKRRECAHYLNTELKGIPGLSIVYEDPRAFHSCHLYITMPVGFEAAWCCATDLAWSRLAPLLQSSIMQCLEGGATRPTEPSLSGHEISNGDPHPC